MPCDTRTLIAAPPKLPVRQLYRGLAGASEASSPPSRANNTGLPSGRSASFSSHRACLTLPGRNRIRGGCGISCGEGNSCGELAMTPGHGVRVRESAQPRVVVRVAPSELGAFIDAVKAGRLDTLSEGWGRVGACRQGPLKEPP
ncbi:DUF397 domain-containing protein [Streptomyces sp. URMC 123]|uniref:DUF397 domain-containing protein n=1 Tax=Streptomyces sp. URMC 123 TaxID=3423403 RepID=UPI003F1E20DD